MARTATRAEDGFLGDARYRLHERDAKFCAAFDGIPAALVILEARTFPQLLLEHTDFLLELFNDDVLVAVQPAGTADQQEG